MSMDESITLQPLSLVTYIDGDTRLEYERELGKGPFIYVGEIPNMPTHGVFIDVPTGLNKVGYHIDSFRELTDDEV